MILPRFTILDAAITIAGRTFHQGTS